jgi:hypothetical protein
MAPVTFVRPFDLSALLRRASVVLLLVASSLPPFDVPDMFYRDAAGDARECLIFRLGSRSEELPRVVAVFRTQTAHKASDFLDLIDQTDVSGLMPIGPSEGRFFISERFDRLT